jgi:hypothetical protein
MSATAMDPFPTVYEPVRQVKESDVDDTDDASGLNLRQEPWWKKLIPLCILLPTCTSLVVLFLHLRHYKTSGVLYRWSSSSRVPVQVAIHLVSSLLSALWVLSVCTVISQWTRHTLSKGSVDLNTLRLWSAVAQSRADWSLPRARAFAALAFFAMTYLPAVLWAGALTPTFTYRLVRDLTLSGMYYLSSLVHSVES